MRTILFSVKQPKNQLTLVLIVVFNQFSFFILNICGILLMDEQWAALKNWKNQMEFLKETGRMNKTKMVNWHFDFMLFVWFCSESRSESIKIA